MIKILTFCLVKAQVPDLHAKMQYLEDFADDDLLRSSLGYGLATLHTCITSIGNINPKAPIVVPEDEIEDLFKEFDKFSVSKHTFQ